MTSEPTSQQQAPQRHPRQRQATLWLVFVIAIVFLADVMTKKYAVMLIPSHKPITVTPFFNLILTINYGVSFAMFTASHVYGVYALIALTSLLSCVVLYFALTTQTFIEKLGFSLVLSGALGNLFDRIRLGGVVDFLDFHVAGYHWPAFNVADAAICMGVSSLFFYHFMLQKK